MNTKPDYSPEEKALILKIYTSGVDVKAQMHLFPGRTYEAIVNRANRMGLKKISIMDLVHVVMKDGKPRTAAAIEKLVEGSHRKYICENLRVAALTLGTYHICGWEGKHLAAVFKFGFGENVERPDYPNTPKIEHNRNLRERRTDAEKKPATRAKAAQKAPKASIHRTTTREPSEAELDAKYRNRGYWWPSGDPVVESAMRSMVSIGRDSQVAA